MAAQKFYGELSVTYNINVGPINYGEKVGEITVSGAGRHILPIRD